MNDIIIFNFLSMPCAVKCQNIRMWFSESVHLFFCLLAIYIVQMSASLTYNVVLFYSLYFLAVVDHLGPGSDQLQRFAPLYTQAGMSTVNKPSPTHSPLSPPTLLLFLSVDDGAILDVQFTDFSYPAPDGFDRIMFEKNIL